MTSLPRSVVTAWQAALAAEQQAVFGYSVLGPRLGSADQELARSYAAAHSSLRDAATVALTAAGQTPVAPLADYPALYSVADAAGARRTAARLEERCADAWRYFYLEAASTTAVPGRLLRRSAQAALTASAVRGARWRVLTTPARATVAFPGL